MSKYLRKIDNVAKIYSLEDDKYKNIFRFTLSLKENINPYILKISIKKTLEIYPGYKVKIKEGLFWNYFDENKKDIIVEKDSKTILNRITFKKNNDYLFKVSYHNNDIFLDVYHVLTDGVGASNFLKTILYNYLNIKYKINKFKKNEKYEIIEDEYLKCVDKRIHTTKLYKKAYLIKEKASHLTNKTYHYILDLKKLKNTCKANKVSITEYITAIYILAIYKSLYNKKSKKDISITIPINLRGLYKVETLSNFFTVMNVDGNIIRDKKITFKRMLEQIHKEFKSKLSNKKIKGYLTRDVKLGTNPFINPIPLFIKKIYMKYNLDLYRQYTTSTVSNIGPVTIENEYKPYIDNIMVEVLPSKLQKAKCTLISYKNKLTVTLNSSMLSNKLETEFSKLMAHYVGNFELIKK